jgi:hypothetical protein
LVAPWLIRTFRPEREFDVVFVSPVDFRSLTSRGPSASARAGVGDQGHRIIALIAERYLDPTTRTQLGAILGGDTDSLTSHDIAGESMWADKYRDSDRNGTGERYRRTRQWHFVDIELDGPNLDEACHNHPRLAPGILASRGPADACIVDKIDQFEAELANPETAPDERLVALKFLLHLVRDVHQPLHAADDHDAGGNRKQAAAAGFTANNLHHFWDIEFVERLGGDPAETAARFVAGISAEQRRAWAYGSAADWAMESFAVARDHAYGMLPVVGTDGVYSLPPSYVETATRDVAVQLGNAGTRLALLLNRMLASARGVGH